jgi:baseplate J-like protein
MSEPCHRGCTCGCCEGVEALTPLSTVNRPGLDAIAYRVGTHSAFFATMRARLSGQDHPELSGLTTRAADDVSIALLDAWATVADVLTFYQERIANEGYLRTATERRSVLELARLVGYELRPGVAASTHLAFTLEERPKQLFSPVKEASRTATVDEPEVVIPAGTRAQSVPGPGELPQPFETSEDLTARAAWNNLQVRLTQPQQPQEVIDAGEIYFKGIATNLKPNDPLLIRTATEKDPKLYRVLTVEPDATAGRTKVTFEDWIPLAADQEDSPAAPIRPVPLADALADIARRFRQRADSEVGESATVPQVFAQLDSLLSPTSSETELRRAVEEVLPKLQKRLEALSDSSTRVKPWLTDLRQEVDAALRAAAAGSAEPATPEISVGEAKPLASFSLTDAVLADLAKPPAKRLASAQHLAREVGKVLASTSDTSAQLVLAAHPGLGQAALYKALANLPLAPQPTLEFWALRTRAAVFGHNAPLELVRRPQDGVILGSREWDLNRALTVAGGEFRFGIQVGVGQRVNDLFSAGQKAQISVRLDGVTEKRELDFSTSPSTSIVVPDSDTVDVTIQLRPFPKIVFSCPQRALTVTLSLVTVDQVPSWQATTEGADPDTLEINFPQPGNETVEQVVIRGNSQRAIGVEQAGVVFLDNSYPQILPETWIALERPTDLDDSPLLIRKAERVSEGSRAAYGLTGKSTRVALGKRWLDLDKDKFEVIRGTAVYAQSEPLELAEMPMKADVCLDELELAALYDGLEPGRWLIVSGERTDVTVLSDTQKVPQRVPGITAAELVMVAEVRQEAQTIPPAQGSAAEVTNETFTPGPRPGERTHTTLVLGEPLAYRYRRDTVKVWGNVAPANHGETRAEVLGSGRASEPWQRFTQKQKPLTHISARTPSGIDSTLQVRVNDVLWHPRESLFGLEPTDHVYTMRRDDEGHTTVLFGDGKRGARVPTGAENVRAVYRVGIGKPGNLDAERITQLVTRPLSVKDVSNPLPATGGADPESRDQAKRNAPLAVMALSRLISVQDYADFARTFAGIGRASATRLSDGRSQLVHVTIAGEDDVPVAETSELFGNLLDALRRFGDPHLRVQLARRDLILLVVSAGVRLHPDYLWEKVAPKIRAALLDALGFPRRDLAQDALASEAVRAMQSVQGVDYVDLDIFEQVGEAAEQVATRIARLQRGSPVLELKPRIPVRPARIDTNTREILPAQLAYLSPALPELIVLKELKS